MGAAWDEFARAMTKAAKRSGVGTFIAFGRDPTVGNLRASYVTPDVMTLADLLAEVENALERFDEWGERGGEVKCR